MKKVVTALFGTAILFAPLAGAYSIKHSYTGPDDATAYHGLCANGDDLMVVEETGGRWKYEGPAGDGVVSGGDLDTAARKACGE